MSVNAIFRYLAIFRAYNQSRLQELAVFATLTFSAAVEQR